MRIIDIFDKFMKDNRDKYNEIIKKKKFKSFDKDEDPTHVINKEESMMGIIDQNEEELDDDKKFYLHAKSVLENRKKRLNRKIKTKASKKKTNRELTKKMQNLKNIKMKPIKKPIRINLKLLLNEGLINKIHLNKNCSIDRRLN
jgi:hypothetical protein